MPPTRATPSISYRTQVANTIKRVAVIVVSVLWFRNPLTLPGVTGSAIAIVGVLLYSLAKAQAPPPLPTLSVGSAIGTGTSMEAVPPKRALLASKRGHMAE